MEALVPEFGLGVTLILIFVGALLAAGKWALPRLLDAYLARAKFIETQQAAEAEDKREQAAEAAAVDRQEEITIVSQVIALQTRLVRQNDELIKFMTATIDHSLNEIKLEIHDIDQRWLTVSNEFGARSKEHQTIHTEITRLIDMLKGMEQRVTSLAAYRAVNEQLRVGGRDEVSE